MRSHPRTTAARSRWIAQPRSPSAAARSGCRIPALEALAHELVSRQDRAPRVVRLHVRHVPLVVRGTDNGPYHPECTLKSHPQRWDGMADGRQGSASSSVFSRKSLVVSVARRPPPSLLPPPLGLRTEPRCSPPVWCRERPTTTPWPSLRESRARSARRMRRRPHPHD